MTSLAENANRDIFVDPATGNIALVSGFAQCEQNCTAAMQVLLGECVLDLQRGLPYDAAMWTRYLPRQFEAAARRTLLGVLNVLAVVTFNINRSGNTASYYAEVKTSFGKNVVLTGVIPNVV